MLDYTALPNSLALPKAQMEPSFVFKSVAQIKEEKTNRIAELLLGYIFFFTNATIHLSASSVGSTFIMYSDSHIMPTANPLLPLLSHP